MLFANQKPSICLHRTELQHGCSLQQGRASDELYRTREKTAEEILKAQYTAAQDTEKVTGLYRGYSRSPYGQPAAPEHARPSASSQVRACWNCLCDVL